MVKRLLKSCKGNWRHIPEYRLEGREKQLQHLVEENFEVLLGLNYVGSEFNIGKSGRIDTIGLEKDSNGKKHVVFVEYKEGHGSRHTFTKHILNQLLHYIYSAKDHLQLITDYVSTQTGDQLVVKNIQRGIAIARGYHTFDKSAIGTLNPRIDIALKEYDYFRDFEDDESFFYFNDTVTPEMLKLEKIDQRESKLLRICNGNTSLLKRLSLDADEDLRKIIKPNMEYLSDTEFVAKFSEIDPKGESAADEIYINLDNKIIIIDYMLESESKRMSIEDRASWAAEHYKDIRKYVEDKLKCEGKLGIGDSLDKKIELLLVKPTFSDEERRQCDLDYGEITPRLQIIESYRSGRKRLAMVKPVVTLETLNAYKGTTPAYTFSDYISRLTDDRAKRALGSLIGKVGKMSRVKRRKNQNDISIRVDGQRDVLGWLRVYEDSPSFNVKFKVGEGFEHGDICSGKDDDGYRRINVYNSKQLKGVMECIKHAYMISGGKNDR
jgi:hypothetical protein